MIPPVNPVAKALIAQAAVQYRAESLTVRSQICKGTKTLGAFYRLPKRLWRSAKNPGGATHLARQFQSAKVLWPRPQPRALTEDAAELSLLADQLAATGELASP